MGLRVIDKANMVIHNENVVYVHWDHQTVEYEAELESDGEWYIPFEDELAAQDFQMDFTQAAGVFSDSLELHCFGSWDETAVKVSDLIRLTC